MKTIEINTKAYVFTSWGLLRGRVINTRIDKYTGAPQYKLDVDIDENNLNKKNAFWYTADQLYKFYIIACTKEFFKPVVRYTVAFTRRIFKSKK